MQTNLWFVMGLHTCITLKRMQIYNSLNESIKFYVLIDCLPFLLKTRGFIVILPSFTCSISGDFLSFRHLGFGGFSHSAVPRLHLLAFFGSFPPFRRSTFPRFHLLGVLGGEVSAVLPFRHSGF